MVDYSQTALVHDKYICKKLIGNGKFGQIYLGIDQTNNKDVAIKLESKDNSYITLKNEATILKYLHDNRCCYIPLLYWFGNFQDKFCIVLSKYDCSLYEYAINNEISENLKNDLMLKMITIIEDIHKNYVVHRDIKPHHFMIKNTHLYLIDFGISTFYINDDRKIKPNKPIEYIIGSPNYVSYFLHEGNTYSRRDDMISLGYIYIFLHCKELPWEKINIEDTIHQEFEIKHEKNKIRKKLKSLNEIHNVVNKINTNIVTYFSFCYYLEYYDEPNYTDNIALFLY